jgi:multiple antibiotic resistance protein
MLQELFSDFIALFVIIDPIGALPLFIALTADDTPQQRRRMATHAVATAYAVLLVFIVAGQFLLGALHIRIMSFQLAGSTILFLFALSLVFGISLTSKRSAAATSDSARAVFPLAIPAIAGPGTMLTVVLLTDNDRFSILEQIKTSLVLGLVLLVTLGFLSLSTRIMRLIGESGTLIVSRIMGLILASIAVENGVKAVAALAKGF